MVKNLKNKGASTLISTLGNRILVFAPHPDDETLGCGGTIARAVSEGASVEVVWITSGGSGHKKGNRDPKIAKQREKEALSAAKILGVSKSHFFREPDGSIESSARVIRKVVRIFREFSPTSVFTTYTDPVNSDHIVTNEIAAYVAIRGGIRIRALLNYEVWTPIETANLFVDIGEFIIIKRRALLAYKSQLKTRKYDEAIIALNRYHGIMRRDTEYAERFKIVYSTL